MILKRGNLWEALADIHIVTTNSFIKKNGALVMGRGAAAELLNICKPVAKEFGRLILDQHDPTDYGCILHPNRPYGIFQVKVNWFDPAEGRLIVTSSQTLQAIATDGREYAMNFPGIGNGRLTREYVLPLIENLPDNVKVYEY